MLKKSVLIIACLLRIALIFYSKWHDDHFNVKFTDIDYNVFTISSEFVKSNLSPYIEKTYRYSPLLAYLLLPNFIFGDLFGKFLFCSCDMLCGFLMYLIDKCSNQQSNIFNCVTVFWLFNPLICTVSSRGNAEAVLGVLILLTLYLLLTRKIVQSGILFGLCIHFKLYPIIYGFSIYLYLCKKSVFPNLLIPNKNHFKFAISTAFSFLLLFCLFFSIYNWEFVYNSYFYHFHRIDIKHNFSIYFYAMYLLKTTEIFELFGKIAFIPQLVLLLFISWQHKRNLIENWLLCTIAFVAFNKVATSQYFMWHLFLLPNALCNYSFTNLLPVLGSYCFWFLCQGVWLYMAYKLEFEGQQMFLFVWIASVLLLFSHVVQIKTMRKLFSKDKIKLKPL